MPNNSAFTPDDRARRERALESSTSKLNEYRPVVAVVATGSTQADAAEPVAGSGSFVTATGADATKGIKLPAEVEPGASFTVKNVDNAILKVYPPLGGTINVLSANAAISMAARTITTFTLASDKLTWYTNPLVPS